MSGGTTFWYMVGGLAALLFFGIAAVVTWRGIGELRDLLGSSKKGGNPKG